MQTMPRWYSGIFGESWGTRDGAVVSNGRALSNMTRHVRSVKKVRKLELSYGWTKFSCDFLPRRWRFNESTALVKASLTTPSSPVSAVTHYFRRRWLERQGLFGTTMQR